MILDASSLLAFLNDEPGADRIARALEGSLVSTVNWSEVVQKSLQRGVDVDGMQGEFSEVGVVFEPYTTSQAETAARLWKSTHTHGLSLAGRACLALAIERQVPVLTADRAWADLKLDIDIQILR